MPRLRLFPAALVIACCGCRSPGPAPLIDPALSACVPANTVFLAGLDVERLRGTPLRDLLGLLGQDASYVLLASDGKDLLWITRGTFRQAPPGATLVTPNLAISGPPESVSASIAQRKSGVADASGILAQAPARAPIWAVARGGVTLPLTGNAANLNRLLRIVDYATLSAAIDSRFQLELAGICRDDVAGKRLEDTLRAILSLAGAANPRLDPTLRSAGLRRDASTVHLTLDTDIDSALKLIDGLGR